MYPGDTTVGTLAVKQVYDKFGRLKQKSEESTDHVKGVITDKYYYDNQNRVVRGETVSGEGTLFEISYYDNIGNELSVAQGTESINRSYDAFNRVYSKTVSGIRESRYSYT